MGETTCWKVVGGSDTGGLLVRAGQALNSDKHPQRLSHGALVKQLALREGRLHFARISGTGPASGWVSVTVNGKQLLEPCEEGAAGTAEVAVAKPVPRGDRKPRVACLHGEPGSAQVLKEQLEPLMRKGRQDIEFVCIDGPIELPEGSPEWQLMDSMFSFVFPGAKYFNYDTCVYDSRGWCAYEKPRETLRHLQAELQRLGPFDGVLGFSGGANFALMLAAAGVAGAGEPLSFAVLLSPSAPGFAEQLPELFERKLPLPVLLTRGAQETYAGGLEEAEFQERLSERGVALDGRGEARPSDHVAGLLEGPEAVTHGGGHVPLPVAEAEALAGRLVAFMLDRCKRS